MIITFIVIFSILSVGWTSDEEAHVDTVYDDERFVSYAYKENPVETEEQERGLHAFEPYPGMNVILEATAPKFGGKPDDIFGFVRDSYPLPGGLKKPYDEYDYVIVGAGSAGSVLASRLTEDKNVTVLLLEAGQTEMLLTDIPSLAPYFQNTNYTWQYYMEKQPGVCTGMINGRCFWPRGKAVGGSSVINYMIYTRGRPLDWDRIAADGNYGWSYNEVLKYFMKSERAIYLQGYERFPYRSTKGELPVQFVHQETKLLEAFLEAGRSLGHPTVDYNSPYKMGFGKVQATIKRSRRWSAAKAFLHFNKKRRNLHILPESTAIKVLIHPENMTAYGVDYVRRNLEHRVRARKEVILSAGPIASPQLLMLSGIGPKKLESVGVDVLKDLPVGKTLYDHICFPGAIFELNTTGVSFKEEYAMNLYEILNWLIETNNNLTTPGGVEGIGYIKTSVSDDKDDVPDIELIDIGGSLTSDGGSGSKSVRRGMRIRDDIFDAAFGEVDKSGKDTWSAFPMLLHPKSFGRIELKDSNPFSHPKMYGNYLTHPKDVATFVAAIRHIQELAATPAFQRFGAKMVKADYPTCREMIFDSDEYWECAVRTLTATLHHQIATCRMGPAGDPRAVVDPELRVYGVNRLRVVDSSVIPRTISAHTHAPAVMIGEKAADMIKRSWNSPRDRKNI